MPSLICNLPSYEVWVRKEYHTDHKSGHGEYVKGVWVSAKSIPGRAFYFETYLPEYAAINDKLPISAFVSSPEKPTPDMELHNLQFWNCMDYGVVAVQKQFIGSMHFEIYTRDYGTQSGTYICTLDNYHQDVDAIDYSTSENPSEHKSHNLLELDNGQFALYPNNRMRIYDNSGKLLKKGKTMTNKNQKMLREIANDTQTPKKRDSKVQNDLWENINDDEFWEGLDYDTDVL